MPDMSAVQMVSTQLCTAQCLLGAGPVDTCGCPCRGRWHGALGSHLVPGSASYRQPAAAPQPGPHLLDELAARSA